MANYAVDPEILKPYVPWGTELDFFQGKTYISLVGFMFLRTRVWGLPFPFHVNFPEVNLRFYVTREENGKLKRGVVFIKELVPRFLIAKIANTLYRENYQALPMKHTYLDLGDELDIRYSWLFDNKWHSMSARVNKNGSPIVDGSEPEYIAEHYWGYARHDDKTTVEYEVKHPRWNILPHSEYEIDCDATRLYGPQFAPYLQQTPDSVFVADGSDISVHKGLKIVG